MRHITLKTIGTFAAAAVLAVPVLAMDATRPATAYPGALNYVEGQVSIGNQVIDSKSVGTAQLQPGESLSTENGKAEMLLTPGVFLRLGDDSTVKMISPNLTDTDVELEKGEATVEVTEIHPENSLRVEEDGATTWLVKTGFYDFDANQSQVHVFDGEAVVQDGDKRVNVKGGHELDLNAAKIKAHGFDKTAYKNGNDLYKWSNLRSAYLAEANADVAGTYVTNGWYGPGWIGTGWYWDPWFSAYTFIPGDGIFYSPFGWGFYSPFWAFGAGYYGGFYGGHYFHHFDRDARAWGPGLAHTPIVRGNSFQGLRTSPHAFAGGGHEGGAVGGFHGDAGFHGSGFAGGGFHGGGGFGGGHGR